MYKVLVAGPDGELWEEGKEDLAAPAQISEVMVTEHIRPVSRSVKSFLSNAHSVEWLFDDGDEHGCNDDELFRIWHRRLWLYVVSDLVTLTRLVDRSGGVKITIMRAKDLLPLPHGYYSYSYNSSPIWHIIQVQETMRTLLARITEKEQP